MSIKNICKSTDNIKKIKRKPLKDNPNMFYVYKQVIDADCNGVINKEDFVNKINQISLENKSPKKQIKIFSPKKTSKKPEDDVEKVLKEKTLDELLNLYKKDLIISTRASDDPFAKNLIDENNSETDNKKKKDSKNPDPKDKKLELAKFFKSKSKRYTIFKHITEYLESNDITLNEIIENNPFQNEPYEISNSYDFIEAIKFNNYNYVIDALKYSTKFLFSIDYYGQTGYHWAAKLGNIKMMKILIDCGRHHNQKDFKGRTPLYLAAVNDKKNMCIFLLERGANPFLGDKDGKTPADVAGSKDLGEFLKNSMNMPFSNPIYKARVNAIIKQRENKMKSKGKLLDIIECVFTKH